MNEKSEKSDWKSVYNYRHIDENSPLKGAPICINCKHCYITPDSVLPVEQVIKLYCNKEENRPLSGDILSEPFDYYEQEVYDGQNNTWNEWVKIHQVEVNGTCQHFQSLKEK